MNFDAERFIRETQRKISHFRSRSTWFKVGGNITAVVVAAIMITALLQATLRALYAFGAHRQAQTMWSFLSETLHPLWLFVLSLPVPRSLPNQNDSILPWALFLSFFTGITLFCAFLKSRGVTLRKLADKAEETLGLQAPLLMQISAFVAAGQSSNVGNVSGNGNTISATNSVTHVLHEGEKTNMIAKLTIPIAVSVRCRNHQPFSALDLTHPS